MQSFFIHDYIPLKICISFPEKMDVKGLTEVEGEFEVNTQYHFYMETQSMLARPSEKGQIGNAKLIDLLSYLTHFKTYRHVCCHSVAG